MRLATASTCVVAWMVVCTPGSLEAQTVRASVSSSGAQSLGGTWVAGTRVAASADGRVIAFDSPVDSLVNDDHNGHRDVFIAADGVITRALPAGVQPNGPSSSPSVSADGRYVVFASEAINLVPGDEYPYSEVLLFDRQNPTGLTLVSVVQHPANQGIDTATRPAISPNARYVAFMATGYGFAPRPPLAPSGAIPYRRDLLTGVTTAVGMPSGLFGGRFEGGLSVADTGEVAFTFCPEQLGVSLRCDVYVGRPDTATVTRVSTLGDVVMDGTARDDVSLSADGRYVSFTGVGIPFAGEAVVVRDRVGGSTVVVSRPLPGQQTTGHSRAPALSHDGRYITFFSSATNLSTQPPGSLGLFRADLRALTITTGVDSVGFSASVRAQWVAPRNAAITTAGTVIFVSDADDLVAGDDNHATDLFAAPVAGPIAVAQATGSGGSSARAAINHDGTVVAFISTAANLVAGDDNQVADAFVKDLRTGAIERLDPGTARPLSPARWVALSDDGRFAAFNQSGAAWLFDRTLRVLTYVGPTTDESTLSWLTVSRVAISGDGRYVAFTSREALDADDTNMADDVYLFDRVTNTLARVGLRDDGSEMRNGSSQPSLSGDGRFVGFLGVDFDTTGVSGRRPFVRDRDASRTYLRAPFFSDMLTIGATVSRDGRRLLHTAARRTDSSVRIEDAAVAEPGQGNATVLYSQPYTTIPRVSNLAMPSATGRVFTWVSTNAAQTNALVRPYAALDGYGAYRIDLSATPGGAPCTGGHERSTANPVISGNGRVVAYESGCVDIVTGDTNGMTDIFVAPTGKADDREPSPGYRTWITTYGLDPDEAAASPWVDTDGDGLTNLAEFTAAPQGNPVLGRVQRHFAEGATSTPLLPFTTRIALANPYPDPEPVRIEYALGIGTAPPTELTLAPWQRTTIVANAQPGLSSAEFGFRVLSTRPIGIDRTMTWDAGTYAGHSDAGAPRPSLTWYFAEGATIAGFQLFYLLQNPSSTTPAEIDARFLLATGSTVTRRYTVAPGSRFNIWANEEATGGTKPLANQEFSAEFRVLNGVPIVTERAMYRDIGGRLFKAGHESTGVVAPAPEWFLAEGNAGDFFDFFVLVANPSPSDTDVQVDYLLGSGQVITRTLTARANSRTTIWVDQLEEPAGSGLYPFRTGQTDISVRVRSLEGTGIVVERAMWWPGQGDSWRESHNSSGATSTAARWIVAEGEVSAPQPAVVGAPPNQEPGTWDTYVLVANTGATAGTIRVTLMVEGMVAPIVVSHTPVGASSRTTFSLRDLLATALIPSGRAAVLIESVGGELPLVVERAMYVSRSGQLFEAGMNSLGTPLTNVP